MDVIQAIADLEALGLNHNEIAKRLKSMGRPVSQSTIHRLRHRQSKNPRYNTVRDIQELRDRLCTAAAHGVPVA